MTTFAIDSPMTHEPQRRFDVNDRVSVPDGRVGRVIGFYHGARATVLVMFGVGDSREYPRTELQRVG